MRRIENATWISFLTLKSMKFIVNVSELIYFIVKYMTNSLVELQIFFIVKIYIENLDKFLYDSQAVLYVSNPISIPFLERLFHPLTEKNGIYLFQIDFWIFA